MSDPDHLWLFRCNDDEPDERLLTLLSSSERERCRRFHFSRDRHLFAAAHGLLRVVLEQCTGIPPQRWEFAVNAYGKPYLPAPHQNLHFNLSHGSGLVAVLLAAAPCGVDVEAIRPLDDLPGMAEMVLHADERAWLARQTNGLRCFFELWTLKEAYLKARGEGFSGLPRATGFDPATLGCETPRLQHAADAQCWHFSCWHHGEHVVALARDAARPLQVHHEWPARRESHRCGHDGREG